MAAKEHELSLFSTEPFTESPKSKIKEFSSEARDSLERKGFIIVELTGQSIKSMREAGKPFFSTWHKNNDEFENLESMQSEVAIIPGLFLPSTANRKFDAQEKEVRRRSGKLRREIPDIKAKIGESPDYIELAFNLFEKTQELGEEFSFLEGKSGLYAVTNTKISGPNKATVGFFKTDSGLNVSYTPINKGDLVVQAAPFILPA